MPMWQLFVPEGAYTADEKISIADGITKLYSETVGLPRFYVTVLFHEVPADSFLIGAEPRNDFVRITVDHIARRFEELPERLGLPEDVNLAETWLAMLRATLDPWIEARGFNWELHVDETPVEFWFIDGLVPPPGWSEEEKRWAEANRSLAPAGGPDA